MLRATIGLALVGLAAACGDNLRPAPEASGPVDGAAIDPDGAAAVDGARACPTFGQPTTAGLVRHGAVVEASGLVASRRSPGVLWVHNDSGGDARVYALSATGTGLATVELAGVEATDWEDLAIGPGPSPATSYLYVGDIGDNGERRTAIRVVRFAEPAVPAPGGAPPTLRVDQVERFELQYPDGAHNAETLLVDPWTGDLYVVVKASSGVSPVFRAAAPLTADAPITLDPVATLRFGAAPLAGSPTTTAGDISAAGDAIAIRTYDAAFVWRRAPGTTVAEALATPPCPVPLADEGQGEALGFDVDGGAYYTLGEGRSAPLSYYPRQ